MNDLRGQNTVEYILMVAVVLGVLLVFLKPQGTYHQAMENAVLNGTLKQLQKTADEIKF